MFNVILNRFTIIAYGTPARELQIRTFVTLHLALFLCAAAGSPSQFPQFEAKVTAYTQLVDRLDREMGKVADRTTAEEVHAHKLALATAIAAARPGARQGDIFVPAEQQQLVRVLREVTAGRDGAAALKAILEDNPKSSKNTPPVQLAPNEPYPDGAPLSTVPPRVLLRLPALPKSVDFRFVGKALVLRDVRANMIVDFIPNALP
jgi:hypothetical protein